MHTQLNDNNIIRTNTSSNSNVFDSEIIQQLYVFIFYISIFVCLFVVVVFLGGCLFLVFVVVVVCFWLFLP